MPGPLFNISAYLGGLLGGPVGIVVCWLGLFGPGVMLIFGVLPFWGWCAPLSPPPKGLTSHLPFWGSKP
eukprot:174909-Prorocentrum_minimum.AAC.1